MGSIMAEQKSASAAWDAFLDAYINLQNSIIVIDDLRLEAIKDLPKTKQKKHEELYQQIVEKSRKEQNNG